MNETFWMIVSHFVAASITHMINVMDVTGSMPITVFEVLYCTFLKVHLDRTFRSNVYCRCFVIVLFMLFMCCAIVKYNCILIT